MTKAKNGKGGASAAASPGRSDGDNFGSAPPGDDTVALRAPKGTAAIGLPLDNDEVLEIRVPKSGVVHVGRDVASRLMAEGFTAVPEDGEQE